MRVYVINQQHRDANPHKSQWTITEQDEVNVFNMALLSSTLNWGVHISSNRIDYLGKNKYRERLFLAKFSENQNIWHGYPADYVRSTHDIPSRDAMLIWLTCRNLDFI